MYIYNFSNENRELINELMLTFTMEEGAPPLSTIDIDQIPIVRISQENLGILLLILFSCYFVKFNH